MAVKYILGVFGVARRGKSETLLLLIDNFRNNKLYSEIYFSASSGSEGDRIAIYEKNGFRIGITTIGDYPAEVEKEVTKLVESQCDIIITATRTKGGTTEVVNSIAKQYNYEKIWFEKNRSVNRWCHD